MRLRSLELKDAELMLEWMHDDSVVHYLQTNFMDKTIDDCYRFINNSTKSDIDIHMAVVDDNDVYMGTVSLKNINDENAEFAITIRACAMGKGYSRYSMETIIEKGFDELNLKEIYWCVSPDNKRAVNFYEKSKFTRVDPLTIKASIEYSSEQISGYIWYKISYEEYRERLKSSSTGNKQIGIEILRIIAAVMICAGHINISLWYNCDKQNVLFPYVSLVEMLCLYGVNVFGLITGYVCAYSKLNTKRILKVIILVMFYSFIGLLVAAIWKPDFVSKDYLLQSFFPISKGVYWYVAAYIVVIVLSPLFNSFLQRIEKKGGVVAAIVLMALALYCFLVNDVLSIGWGYNAVWLSWLYIMGGVLRIMKDRNYFPILYRKRIKGIFILLYCFSAILNWIVFFRGYENAYINARTQRYNNVFIVFGAVSLFIGLHDIEIKKPVIKKAVLFFSSCCLSVYLIQVNPLFWNQIISEKYLYLMDGSAKQYLIHFVIHVLASFILLSGIDKVRQLLFELLRVNKLMDGIGDKLNQYIR